MNATTSIVTLSNTIAAKANGKVSKTAVVIGGKSIDVMGAVFPQKTNVPNQSYGIQLSDAKQAFAYVLPFHMASLDSAAQAEIETALNTDSNTAITVTGSIEYVVDYNTLTSDKANSTASGYGWTLEGKIVRDPSAAYNGQDIALAALFIVCDKEMVIQAA